MEICKHEGCGGCLYQGTPYEEQLKIKDAEVRHQIQEKEIECGEYLGITGSPRICAYRNKMDYTFGDEVKDGEMTLGMHRKKRFMSVITTDTCMLVCEDFNRILRASLDFMKSKGYPFYHKKSHVGLQRNLVIRRGERTGELLINLVTTSQFDFDTQAFTDMLLGLGLDNEIVGVVRTIHDGVADFIYCDSFEILYGRDYYIDEIMNLKFQVSAFSFFQTNVEAVERLYLAALDMIPDIEDKTVFDLYCGTGTITQAMAKKAKLAVGVEIVEDAVRSAEENAKINGLSNCKFICGDVLEKLDEVTEKPDIIVVDPPRVGIHPKALKKIIDYGTDEILYISCNPKTMMENIKIMQEAGYRAVQIQAFDNFPFTKHIESVCLLVR